MIDSKKLLSALQKHVRQLEEDLRARCDGNADVDRPVRIEYEAAQKKGRTALTYSAWRDEELTQVAVAWVLASVFVRFLEDNELIETPYLAGPGSRLQRAKDEHEMFFRKHPTLTEREYFEKVFTKVGTLVLHGRRELGTVHQIAFLRHRADQPAILSLGGRSWAVTSLEWPK